MTGIRVADRAVVIPNENGYCRILVSFFVFAAKIVLKCARAGTQKSQSVPASIASVASQARQIGGGNNNQIQILSQMMCDAIEAVNPRRTHRARLCLFLAEHEVINDDRTIRAGEKEHRRFKRGTANMAAPFRGFRRRITGLL